MKKRHKMKKNESKDYKSQIKYIICQILDIEISTQFHTYNYTAKIQVQVIALSFQPSNVNSIL